MSQHSSNNSGMHYTDSLSEQLQLLITISNLLATSLRKRRFEPTLQAKALGDYLAYVTSAVRETATPLRALSVFSRYCLLISKSNGTSRLGRIIGGSSANAVFIDIVDIIGQRKACVAIPASSAAQEDSVEVAPQKPPSKRSLRREKRLQSLESKATTSSVTTGCAPIVEEAASSDVLAAARSDLPAETIQEQSPVAESLPSNHGPSRVAEDAKDCDAEEEPEPEMDYETRVMLGLERRSAAPPSVSGISDDLGIHPKASKSQLGKHVKPPQCKPANMDADPLGIPSRYMEEPSAKELNRRRNARSRKSPACKQNLEPRNSAYQKKWNKPGPTREFFEDRPALYQEPEGFMNAYGEYITGAQYAADRAAYYAAQYRNPLPTRRGRY